MTPTPPLSTAVADLDLPKLPTPEFFGSARGGILIADGFSAAQMSDHARSAVIAALARSAAPAPASGDGFALPFSREDWGVIFDGVMLEIERSEKRKQANAESNSDARAEQGRAILAAIRKASAATASDIAAAPEQQQDHVAPPTRGTDSQHDAYKSVLTDDRIIEIVGESGLAHGASYCDQSIAFARAIEKELVASAPGSATAGAAELPVLPRAQHSIDIYHDNGTVTSVDGYTADEVREQYHQGWYAGAADAAEALSELASNSATAALNVMDDRRAFAEWFNGTMYRPDTEEAMLIGWQASTAHYAAEVSPPDGAMPELYHSIMNLSCKATMSQFADSYDFAVHKGGYHEAKLDAAELVKSPAASQALDAAAPAGLNGITEEQARAALRAMSHDQVMALVRGDKQGAQDAAPDAGGAQP